MTKRLYLADHELSGTARVEGVGSDDKGHFLVLDQTIFHPQGGGQKSDRGRINDVAIDKVLSNEGQVRHYVDSPDKFTVGQTVQLEVDVPWRKQQAAYHSAGHVLAAVVSECYPELVGVAGHHWPGESRVDFDGQPPADIPAMTPKIEEALKAIVAADVPLKVVGDPFVSRAVQVGESAPVPCGGTHVRSTAELGRVVIRSVKVKSGKTRVSYEVEAN